MSESLIQDAFDRLLEGRTSIVIAHRLSTVRNVDSICVVEAGRIGERGTHRELMQIDGVYATLVARQLGRCKQLIPLMMGAFTAA